MSPLEQVYFTSYVCTIKTLRTESEFAVFKTIRSQISIFLSWSPRKSLHDRLYFYENTGVLAVPGIEGIGFYRSEFQPKEDIRPYMQSALLCVLPGSSPLSTLSSHFNMKTSVSCVNSMAELGFPYEGCLSLKGLLSLYFWLPGRPLRNPPVDCLHRNQQKLRWTVNRSHYFCHLISNINLNKWENKWKKNNTNVTVQYLSYIK